MADDPADPDQPYYDLGSYRRDIACASPAAATWFNRGLVWCYGFNHDEAARCFERAAAADPDCAMAHWGLAYALGPNYNKPWDAFDDDELHATVRRTRAAVDRARACAESPRARPVEQALVAALSHRYPDDRPAPDCSVWNRAYADAMAAAYAAAPADPDVAALYADALMNLAPWQLWDQATGAPNPDAPTLEAKSVLEAALAQNAGADAAPGRAGASSGSGYSHPGLLHLYIHLMEMSAHPEAALPAANALRGLVPDAGHLEHMPTHIDVLVGDYERGVRSNGDAVAADDRFLAREGPLNFYTLYRVHDMHFRVYCAMFAGQSGPALEAAGRLDRELTDDLLRVRSPPMADWLEGFAAMRLHALVRFGRWADILALPFPADPSLRCATVPMLHYARGVALAVTAGAAAPAGDDEALLLARAEAERQAFRAAARLVPASRTVFNNKVVDILRVAEAVLDGEVAYRSSGGGGGGGPEAAFAHLREAAARYAALPYDEPWGWMQPPAHALGALLLESGRAAEALAVYAGDLGIEEQQAVGTTTTTTTTTTTPRCLQHPGNVWALHGYHECLERLGCEAEARAVEPRLREALARADVPIRSSCFCRRSAGVGAG